MSAGNSVYSYQNYVDVVQQQQQQNQVFLDPQMFTVQAAQAAQLQQQQTTATQAQQASLQATDIQNLTGTQHSMMQQAVVPQGLAVQQMMPPGMIISNGMGGFIQYPQTISPFGVQFSQAGMSMGQMGQMQMILQPTMNIRHAKPVGRTPIPRNGGISGSQGTGLSDQSGAGKVKKKKPSPSARRRSRLRLIAFLEAKRKKAEEEGIPEEGTVEQIKQLEKEQAMDDAEQAEQRAGGSVCQSGNSSPTVATNSTTSTTGTPTSTTRTAQPTQTTPTQTTTKISEQPIPNSSDDHPVPKD